MGTKLCKNCGSTFQGRMNKKFCSSNCKNEHHNSAYREKNQVLARLDKILHKNRAVLRDMYHVHRSSPINIEVLKARGFNPAYHTHIFTSPAGGKFTMIYDVGYKLLFDNQIQIVELEAAA